MPLAFSRARAVFIAQRLRRGRGRQGLPFVVLVLEELAVAMMVDFLVKLTPEESATSLPLNRRSSAVGYDFHPRIGGDAAMSSRPKPAQPAMTRAMMNDWAQMRGTAFSLPSERVMNPATVCFFIMVRALSSFIHKKLLLFSHFGNPCLARARAYMYSCHFVAVGLPKGLPLAEDRGD